MRMLGWTMFLVVLALLVSSIVDVMSDHPAARDPNGMLAISVLLAAGWCAVFARHTLTPTPHPTPHPTPRPTTAPTTAAPRSAVRRWHPLRALAAAGRGLWSWRWLVLIWAFVLLIAVSAYFPATQRRGPNYGLVDARAQGVRYALITIAGVAVGVTLLMMERRRRQLPPPAAASATTAASHALGSA